jgi:hypothetical protein
MIDCVDIELIWQRIVKNQGKIFKQKKGKEFTYRVKGDTVFLETTNHSFSKGHLQRAFKFLPLEGPGKINHLHAPSYIYGVLMDNRIKDGDW